MNKINGSADVKYSQIDGYPGYRVGDDGSIWTSKIVGANGRIGDQWRKMKLDLNKHGYFLVRLCHKGRSKAFYVHHLVLSAFIGPRPKNAITRHLNADRGDNRAANLAWGTFHENSIDMVNHGNSLRGEKHHKAILTKEQVVEIKGLINNGDKPADIASMFGVAKETIASIKSGRNWGHVSA